MFLAIIIAMVLGVGAEINTFRERFALAAQDYIIFCAAFRILS
jgi:hypothetical protein